MFKGYSTVQLANSSTYNSIRKLAIAHEEENVNLKEINKAL